MRIPSNCQVFLAEDDPGEAVHLDASIGIALVPESPQETASDVLRQADMAMHQAKTEGGGRAVFFETTMGETVRERSQLERELRHGVAEASDLIVAVDRWMLAEVCRLLACLDAALVETIRSVARHLHLQVVAEGVETAAQADFLKARGEVIHQGYLYGRPQAVETWLARLHEGDEAT